MAFPFGAKQRLCALFLLVLPFCSSAQQKNSEVLSVTTNKADNTIKTISFAPSATYTRSNVQQLFSTYLGTDGSQNKMELIHSTTTKLKITTDRYRQVIKGVPVEHGSFATTEKDGYIRFISGNYYKYNSAIDARPSLTEPAAFAKAKAFVGATKYMWEMPSAEARLKSMLRKPDTSYLPKGRLTWVEDLKSGSISHQLHLAYAYDIYAAKPVSRQMVYVDATDGKILFVNNLIHHTAATNRTLYSGVVTFETANTGSTYVLFDSTRGNGVYTLSANYDTGIFSAIDITSNTNYWPTSTRDTLALDAHWGAEMVFDYFLNEQGRRSWDDAYGQLTSYVHITDIGFTPLDNAYWDGSEMVYGDGSGRSAGGYDPLTTLDISAHEIGHGVCQATSNLVYSYESGAMNEGFSDCWAATIENWANPLEADAVAKQPWKIGEEINAGTPLRSMDNPLLQGDPATYGGTNWFNTSLSSCPTPTSTNDECGVHTNSGVLNHWYYFVVNGGVGTNDRGTSYNVNAIGWTDAASILYQTELALGSTDDYAACRVASILVAQTIFGVCSAQEQCVTNAWNAVGVGPAFTPCTPQIGFNMVSMNVSENASSTACPASRTINIPVHAFGTPITGGSPTITIVAAGGTAVSGVDYTLGTTSITIPPSDTTTHYATIVVYDNGTVNDDKTLQLAFTLSTAGSTATISSTNDTLFITFSNNDSIPSYGGNEYHTLNIGSTVTNNLTSAFAGTRKRAHNQYLLDATEMAAAGVRPGVAINQLAFNITTKNSTGPFVNYTVSMGNTTAGNLSSGYATAGTTVFSANHTTNAGWDSLTFSTPFTWDGTSNVVVEICYGANTSSYGANDLMQGIDNTPYIVTDVSNTNTGTGTGCTLTYNAGGTNTARPVMRFRQMAPPSTVETNAGSTRTWTVKTGNEVYYYTPTADTNVIAGTANENNDLGCVTAAVTQAGVGFTAASFASINRSRKEIAIVPTINGSTTTYDVHFYMTNTELAGVSPTTLYLVRTTATTDTAINASNTVINIPVVNYGTNFVDFKSTYTGFGRYFLTDGVLCTPPATSVTTSGATSFCSGGNVVLTAPSGTGYTYQWINSGTPIAGATNRTYTATTTGSYSVTVTQSGCSATSTGVAVTVSSAYAAVITGATGVCIGSTALVTDSTTGGTWSSSNPSLASIGATTGMLYGVAAGTVTITYSYTNACGTATRTASITVSTPATVSSISGTTSGICAGTNTTLTNATSSGTWSSSNTALATISTTGVVTGLAAGTVTISYGVANAFGCVSYATTPFIVNAGPAATITPSGSTTLCLGASVTLNAATGTGVSYQWQVGGSNITGATTTSYTASATGNYGLVVTNASGCATTAAVVPVTVTGSLSVTPAVSITTTPGTLVCSGTGAATYTPNPINGGSAPAYVWYVNGAVVASSSTYSYVPANGDVVTVKMTSDIACAFPDTAVSSVTMTVSPYVSPAVSINAIPGDSLCAGSTGAFGAVPTNGGTSPSYTWNLNGADVYYGPYYYYVPTDGDVLICSMVSNFLCRLTDNATSAPLTVHVSLVTSNTITIAASATSIDPGNSVTFTATAPTAGASPAYQWFVDGRAVPGATASTYTTNSITNGQVVTCRVTASDRCTSPATVTSSGITMAVSTGIAGNGAIVQHLAITPNPNTGTFRVSGTVAAPATTAITLKVVNLIGQVVYTSEAAVRNGSIDEEITLPKATANGMYLLHLLSNTQNEVYRITVQK